MPMIALNALGGLMGLPETNLRERHFALTNAQRLLERFGDTQRPSPRFHVADVSGPGFEVPVDTASWGGDRKHATGVEALGP